MAKVKLFTQGSEEWLRERLKYITATEVACLFRMGNQSVAKLMESKLDPPEKIKNEFMTIGNILEPAVIESFRVRMNLNVQPAHPDKVVFMAHDDIRLSVTPDGKLDHNGEFYIIECKTTGSKDVDKARENFEKWKDAVPVSYALQVQAQLMVAGVDKALIGCMGYIFPLPFVVYEINKNERIQEILTEEVTRFWDCLENNKMFKYNKDYIDEVKKLLAESEEMIYYKD
jgi:predicted phage-related endonuclease